MSHKAALQRLIPVELGGVFDADLTIEAEHLDLVQADIEAQRLSMLADIASLLPPADNHIPLVPVRWSIRKPFYVELAAALGYQIYIRDYIPAMSDWLCADDELIGDEPWMEFNAGVSLGGDYMAQEDTVTPWIWEVVVVSSPDAPPTPNLEAVLEDLKPAHIQLNFTYL